MQGIWFEMWIYDQVKNNVLYQQLEGGNNLDTCTALGGNITLLTPLFDNFNIK